jgi:hypothetical protein
LLKIGSALETNTRYTYAWLIEVGVAVCVIVGDEVLVAVEVAVMGDVAVAVEVGVTVFV